MSKVRPSKDFLPPLCQIWDTQLSYLCQKNTQNWHQLLHTIRKTRQKKFCGLQYNTYLNEIWPVSKKVWAPLVCIQYSLVIRGIFWVRNPLRVSRETLIIFVYIGCLGSLYCGRTKYCPVHQSILASGFGLPGREQYRNSQNFLGKFVRFL